MPRSRVLDRILVTNRVAATPQTMAAVKSSAASTEPPAPTVIPSCAQLPYAKNMVKTAISAGKRPLQGTRLWVRIASMRSRGESMMRQPVTPAALQPKPMHMVSACLPQAQQR